MRKTSILADLTFLACAGTYEPKIMSTVGITSLVAILLALFETKFSCGGTCFYQI